MIAQGNHYSKISISLDGCTFIDCTFDNCKILFSGLLPVNLDGNRFNNCLWEFVGPASNTVAFMTAMYAGGSAQLIEEIMSQVKRGTVEPTTRMQ